METEHDGGEEAPPPVPAPTPTSLSLPVPSSILATPMPTIPIYHLQQTAPDAINSFTSSGHGDEEQEMSNSGSGGDGGGGYMNGNMLNVDTCLALNSTNRSLDWSNSLFRPISRFSMTNRRECKSTSDEASTFEVNALAIDPAPTSSPFISNDYEKSLMPLHAISPARYQPTHLRPRIPHHNHGHHHANLRFLDMVKQKQPKPVITTSTASAAGSTSAAGTSWSLSNAKTFYGQFGLNPSLFNLSRVKGSSSTARETSQNSTCHVTTNKFHRMGASTSSSMKERKFVKRLSSSNKFGIESLNKKHGDYNYNKKLFHAVLNEDPKAVSELLETNQYDVNCCDEKQRTCLHIASSRGNSTIVRLLLQNGANPNIKDCVSNLPIHVAIIASHVEVVTLLLEAGTDINALELNGKTVLHLAGTRLRYLLSDENNTVSPKLKCEAIMIMNMIKEYLNRKKSNMSELDALANQLENVFTVDDINHVTKELLNKFESFSLNKGGF